MNKIILVGLVGNHHSLYKGLLLLLSNKFDRITFLTNDKEVQQIDHLLNKNIVSVVSDSGRFDEILKRKLSFINNHDILILDGYYGAYKELTKLKFKCRKKVLLVHNVNKWFQEKFRYDLGVFIFHFFKNKFFNHFDAYITMGPNVKEYFKTLKNDKPVFFFPFDQSSGEIIDNESIKDTIDIVLPGMISEDRRNYKDILNVLERYYQDFPNSRIRIKFLGKIFSANESFVAEISENINNSYGEKVIYWKEFIPDKEFENEIKKADFILSNVHVFNDLDDRLEIYGITKETGVSFIIYKYAKIAIVPRFQNILSGFENQLIKFNEYHDLYEIFRKIENNEIDLEKLSINANKNKKIFNDKIKKENEILLEFLTER